MMLTLLPSVINILARFGHGHHRRIGLNFGPILDRCCNRFLIPAKQFLRRIVLFYIERHGYPGNSLFRYLVFTHSEMTVRWFGGVFCIVSETTERRLAVEVERKLAAIVATSQDAILSTDDALRITSWNVGAENLYGYVAKEVIGRSVTFKDSGGPTQRRARRY